MNYLLFGIMFFGALAFANMVQRQYRRLPPRAISVSPPRWRALSRPMQAFGLVVAASWLMMMALMLTDSYVETEALRQPIIAEGSYRYPEAIKGGIRYLTEGQERIYSLAHPWMFWLWGLTLVLGATYKKQLSEQSERDRRLRLDRLLADDGWGD